MRGMSCAFVVAALVGSFVRPMFFADAAEVRSGEKVIVKEDETIEDDLYVFGQEITIDGTVEGDVIAWGQQITVNGKVNGNVMAIGQTVVITGATNGARIAGQVLKLGPKAKLDGDLLAAGFSLECTKDSEVTRDVLYAGYQAMLSGLVGNNLRGGMVNCLLEGNTGGNVDIEVGGDKKAPPMNFGPAPPVAFPSVPGGLTVAETATIEGDLRYEAKQEARIDPKATVSGEVTFSQEKPAAKPGRKVAKAPPSAFAKTLGRAKHLACVALVGLAVLLLFPRWSTAWADTIRTRPGASFLGGLVGLAAFFVLLALIFFVIGVAASLLGIVQLSELVPMLIIGGVVGYSAIFVGAWILYWYLAEALAGLAIGRFALRDDGFASRAGALILGTVLVAVVLSVPVVGWLIGLVVVIFGIGGICLWLIGQSPAAESFGPPAPGKPMPATVL